MRYKYTGVSVSKLVCSDNKSLGQGVSVSKQFGYLDPSVFFKKPLCFFLTKGLGEIFYGAFDCRSSASIKP